MRRILNYGLLIVSCMLLLFTAASFSGQPVKKGKLTIHFINTANGKHIILNDYTYTNAFGERYSISKLKYYVSDLTLSGNKDDKGNDNCFLIDASSPQNDIELAIPAGNYNTLFFLLGVDSMKNCSGAQTGALDALNGMFWTWNSGYVVFKLEGSSTASTADLNRIEQHIGGYRNGNNVSTKIGLSFHEIKVSANTNLLITVEVDLDKYWKGNNDTRISDIPVCTSPGAAAKKIAANFQGLFSIKNISAQ